MSKQDKKKNETATLIIIIIAILLFTASGIKVVKGQETGYLVCTSGIGGVKCKETQSIKVVDEMTKLKFPSIKINIAQQLKHSNYIQIMTENSALYIEKKRIVCKRNGKKKFKKIKK